MIYNISQIFALKMGVRNPNNISYLCPCDKPDNVRTKIDSTLKGYSVEG